MYLKVLVDNNTYIDHYYLAEPAVSYYIEDGHEKILFDVGYSDVLLKNAEALGIDLGTISKIVISHGHNDHTGGFAYLQEKHDLTKINVIAHPDAFNEKVLDQQTIGSPLRTEDIKSICKLTLSKTPLRVSENIIFLGEIPTVHGFEMRKPIGQQRSGDLFESDYIYDDTALVYKNRNGIFIITGCSHSGICNIIEYAKQVCNEQRLLGIIGGFHLFDVNEKLGSTIEYLVNNGLQEIYPCHCLSFQAKAEINKYIPVREVGVGMTIALEP